MDILKSTAVTRMVFMADSTDHLSGKTGLTLTITASKAGAAFAPITPTVVDLGSGWYSLALTALHTDTVGDLALHITAAGADPTDVKYGIAAQTATSISKNAFAASDLPIGTVTSQTSLILTGGPANDIANVTAIIFDSSASDAPVVADGAYVGSTGTLTLSSAPAITVTTSDRVTLLASASTTLSTDAISAATISSAAVTKIQSGLATPTNITAGTITTVSGNVTGSVGSVVGGINTGSGTITTLDALDTAQDSQHALNKAELDKIKKLGDRVRHTLDATNGTAGTPGAYDETTETKVS